MDVARTYSPRTHFHQLKAFSASKQKLIFPDFNDRQPCPKHKLREEESASSVQVGCKV